MDNLPTEGWWTPRQSDVVEDRSRTWQEEVFQPRDAVSFRVKDGTMIRPKEIGDGDLPEDSLIRGGWDHEHCALCWQTISRHTGHEPSGYTDGNEWLCRACYDKYIVPRITTN